MMRNMFFNQLTNTRQDLRVSLTAESRGLAAGARDLAALAASVAGAKADMHDAVFSSLHGIIDTSSS